MFKKLFLYNIDIDRGSPKYRRVIITNIVSILGVFVSIVFTMVFFSNPSMDISILYIVILNFMISAWMFIIIRKESYSIERIANIATFLIAAIFLLILFTLEAKDYTGIWILIFGQLVFTLNGERKGLLYAVIFYLISFTYIYQLIGINIEMIEYIRLIVISFTLTLLSYYYEISINTTYKSLEKSTNENKSNLLALQEINEEISQQIYIDKLTGLYNYSALELNIEKSNIPVFPGFFPVIIETQAGPVSGGLTDFRRVKIPLSAIFEKLGNFPLFMNLFRR